jgi:biofilm PGA synthesis N-glycosyltransferase PgaC
MHDDTTYKGASGRVALDGRVLDAQPVPRTAVDVAIARAGIRPVADAAFGSARTIASSERPTSNASFYLGVRAKFAVALVASSGWFALTVMIALPWIAELSRLFGPWLAWFAVGGIALVPGFMNAFLIASLLLDRRPARMQPSRYPAVSILVPTCDAEAVIADTLRSIANQDYPGAFEVFVIDTGSRDRTAAIVDACDHDWLRLLRLPADTSRSAALNRGLAETRFDLVLTLDEDSFLYRDALRNIVERYLSDPPNTRAVAGTMLVRNSRKNWVTKAQEWDYFHGIAAIKRVQSLYQGTLVAQGAFSIYERAALRELGGWPDCVGRDVVVSWTMLRRGWRIGHAEDACCFANAPDTLRRFVAERQQWARGMVEAFRQIPGILIEPRLSTFFIWWNLLFPWLDLAYTVLFIPGILLALAGIYWIAGPWTLAWLPMALGINYVMYRVGSQMFAANGLRVRRNLSGFLTYAFMYSLVLQPACVAGYVSEIFGSLKASGRK